MRISLIVESFSSISSGPSPKVSSSTSLTSRSRSERFSSVSSVSQRCSTTRRISRRSVSPSNSPTRDRSSLSTSLAWMLCLSSSRLLSFVSAGRGGIVSFGMVQYPYLRKRRNSRGRTARGTYAGPCVSYPGTNDCRNVSRYTSVIRGPLAPGYSRAARRGGRSLSPGIIPVKDSLRRHAADRSCGVEIASQRRSGCAVCSGFHGPVGQTFLSASVVAFLAADKNVCPTAVRTAI